MLYIIVTHNKKKTITTDRIIITENNYESAKIDNLEFLRASGVCTFVFCIVLKFLHSAKNQKTKEQTNFFIFFALKNTKFWCKLNTFVPTQKKRKDNKTAATPQSYCF